MTDGPLAASCSIVCYDQAADIERILHSLAASEQFRHRRLALYLIDNGPTARLEPLARRFGARYRHRPDNPGYGRAHNWALRRALATGSQYHFVLNPDITFDATIVGRMLDYMERHPDIGLLAPRVQYADGRLQRLCKLLPEPADLLARRLLPGWYRRSGREARYELHASGYDTVMDVPVLSGCFMLLRVDVLRLAGIFDERFFLYFEDVDLSRRIGGVARTAFYPHACIVHGYTRGSYRSAGLLWHHAVSAVRYFNKWGWFRDHRREQLNGATLARMAGGGARRLGA
jgi:GT2 family glycosyltransferase